MSDLNEKVNQIAEWSWLKLSARVALPVIAFVGASAWSDLKEQGKQINQVLQNMSRYEQTMSDMDRRVTNLEDWQKQITYRGTNP